MVRRRLLTLLLATLPLLLGAASPDETAIRQILERQQAAWNKGDIKAFMEGYENSPDTTFVGASGVTRGYQPVLDNYLKRYPTRDAMGQLTFSAIEVHMIAPGSAWVFGRFHLKRNAAGGGDKSGSYTLVCKKTGAGWKVVLDHTN
ncbi:MAG: nuclear transport factor 2 family protein [Bryobacterales bacterium]|nr:nuclear transport factor 2 family protein [Bryobacterales bacterium]